MVDDCWEIDLLDVHTLKTYNDDFTYILEAIDVLSKFARMETHKDKSGASVATAFQNISNRSGGRVKRMISFTVPCVDPT